LFAVGGFVLFLVFVVVTGHAVLRRARLGAFICHFLIRKWEKGVPAQHRSNPAVNRVNVELELAIQGCSYEPTYDRGGTTKALRGLFTEISGSFPYRQRLGTYLLSMVQMLNPRSLPIAGNVFGTWAGEFRRRIIKKEIGT